MYMRCGGVVSNGAHNHLEMNGCVSSYSWQMERPVGQCLAVTWGGEQGIIMQCPGYEQRNQVNTLPIAVRLLKYRCYMGKTVNTP